MTTVNALTQTLQQIQQTLQEIDKQLRYVENVAYYWVIKQEDNCSQQSIEDMESNDENEQPNVDYSETDLSIPSWEQPP